MKKTDLIKTIEGEIINCRRCPRLVAWREDVARQKRKAYSDWDYWGKPVPGFGDPKARVMAVGLAPGAHGSNRTGRMFTGDASGDFLFPALYKAGFSNQTQGKNRTDGMKLNDLFITSVCRCVPPENKPSHVEMNSCQSYIEQEIAVIQPIIFVALGRIAFDRILIQFSLKSSALKFDHGAIYPLDDQHILICSYHPSRQNTQTGRLTMEMFDQIWSIARNKLDLLNKKN